jgi:hypothetical protein
MAGHAEPQDQLTFSPMWSGERPARLPPSPANLFISHHHHCKRSAANTRCTCCSVECERFGVVDHKIGGFDFFFVGDLRRHPASYFGPGSVF